MEILKLKPACKDYLWGGHRLPEEYNIEFEGPVCAEAWELSCHPDGPSVVANGEFEGRSLKEYLDAVGAEVLGKDSQKFEEFPVLLKLIDARKDLSIQVHPDDEYAREHEGQNGKTEMWYILDAKPGAFIYYGFEKEISKEEFEKAIREETLTELLHKEPVKKGDHFFIEPGTLHAIGEGILLAEIQQNSNVTYRIFDYGRVGADGKKRELHVAKALDVTRLEPVAERAQDPENMESCRYFTVKEIKFENGAFASVANSDSFVSLLILDGHGMIAAGDQKMPYKKGDSFFIPAGLGKWRIEGICHALKTTV